MLKSFVGIATRSGLEVFLPEHEHSVRFLARRSLREARRQAVCYWAVVSDDVAAEVQHQMELGESFAALLLLDQGATEIGSILPATGFERQDSSSARFQRAYPTAIDSSAVRAE
jgi:hypothetical protein